MIKENSTLPRNLLLSLLLLGIILLVFRGYFHEISAINQDLGRHLLTGQLIWQTKTVPSINLYSYTFPDFIFINHHWLSEVIFYLVQRTYGFSGLLFMTSSIMAVSVGLLFWITSKKTSLVTATFVTLLYLPILFDRTELRPEIFSYCFMIFFLIVLFSFRDRYTKWIYILPIFSLLWVNSHIYFPVGLLLIFLFFLDTVWKYHKNPVNKQVLSLVGVGILSGLMTLLNPHGITGALYPLHVFQNYGYTIEENQTLFLLTSLGFSRPSFLIFELSVFLLITALLLTIKKARLIDWLLAITFTVIAFFAVRNFPLFAFATFIPLSRNLTILFKSLQEKISIPYLYPSLLSILFFFLAIHLSPSLINKPFNSLVPIGAKMALDFYQSNNLTGPIFNNFDIGSYIEYRLYPQERVFIDGRPEAYPATFLQETYIPMQEDAKVFAEVDRKYHFNTIVFSHTDQTPWAQTFLPVILQNSQWVPVYLDPMMIILVKNTPDNKSIISTYGMTYPHLKMDMTHASRQSLYSAASFFRKAGLSQQEQAIYQQLLRQNPRNCPVLYQLALSENQQNPLTLQRYELYCR